MLEVESFGFTGPTLATAGLSFLMPLVKPKKIVGHNHSHYVVISKGDARLAPVLWIFVFIFLFSWSFACYTSIKHPDDKTLGISSHLAIGGLVYLFSLILTFIKEKV